MKKIIPEQKMADIAHSLKGVYTFKTNSRNQFYPYELLNYTKNYTLIVPLRRTARGQEILLNQHGYDLRKTYYIDILSKHINSSLEHKNTKYLHQTNLKELHDEILEQLDNMGNCPKTLIIDDIHSLIPHHGELKTRRFLDNLTNNAEKKLTKTILLTDHKKLPTEVSKFLFHRSNEILEL
jgi:hypothetical protein